jgi:hypothetical protein
MKWTERDEILLNYGSTCGNFYHVYDMDDEEVVASNPEVKELDRAIAAMDAAIEAGTARLGDVITLTDRIERFLNCLND